MKNHWLSKRLDREAGLTIDKHGTKRWKNKAGLLHRTDGPAMEFASGTKSWYINGRLHREDGPAIEWVNDEPEYWLDGVQVIKKDGIQCDCPQCEKLIDLRNNAGKVAVWDFQSALGDTIKEKHESLYVKVVELSNVINRKTISQENWLVFPIRCFFEDGSADGFTIDGYGNHVWLNEKGHFHREDGPAIISPSGAKHWYINGLPHREDGPAIESLNEKCWYINGRLHREDGPAIEYATGSKSWFVNGQRHREDGPADEWSDGRKEYWLNGKHVAEKVWREVCENRVDPFYEMIESRIKGKRRCKDCYRRLWLQYCDGHVADRCFDCPYKWNGDLAGYVTTYDIPVGPMPDHIEARDDNRGPWEKPHEMYYRLKANLEDLKLDVLWQNPYILGVDSLKTNCSSLTNE